MTLETQAMADQAKARAKLESDPHYKAYKQGFWEFSQTGSDAGRGCSAFFSKLEGAILVFGQKGDKGITFLTFMGPNIPKPGSTSKIKVTLEQTDSAPETVQAFNHAVGGNMGAITFSVPLEIAAASAMFLDQQSFRLS